MADSETALIVSGAETGQPETDAYLRVFEWLADRLDTGAQAAGAEPGCVTALPANIMYWPLEPVGIAAKIDALRVPTTRGGSASAPTAHRPPAAVPWHVSFLPIGTGLMLPHRRNAVLFDWPYHTVSGRSLGGDPRRNQLDALARADLVIVSSSHTAELLTAAGISPVVEAPPPVGLAADLATTPPIGAGEAPEQFSAPVWACSGGAPGLRSHRLTSFMGLRPGPMFIAAVNPFRERASLKALVSAAAALERGKLLIALDLETNRASLQVARGLLGLDDLASEIGERLGFLAQPIDGTDRKRLAAAADFVVAPSGGAAGGTAGAGVWSGPLPLLQAMAAGAVPVAPSCPPLWDWACTETAILCRAERRAVARDATSLGVPGLFEWAAAPAALADAFRRAEAMAPGYAAERARRASARAAERASDEVVAERLAKACGWPAPPPRGRQPFERRGTAVA